MLHSTVFYFLSSFYIESLVLINHSFKVLCGLWLFFSNIFVPYSLTILSEIWLLLAYEPFLIGVLDDGKILGGLLGPIAMFCYLRAFLFPKVSIIIQI